MTQESVRENEAAVRIKRGRRSRRTAEEGKLVCSRRTRERRNTCFDLTGGKAWGVLCARTRAPVLVPAPRTASLEVHLHTYDNMKKAKRSVSTLQLFFMAVCSMVCCRTISALPAISTYSAIRSGSLNSDGEGTWPSEPSQDLEVYKLLYEIANTVERPPRHADGLFTSGYSKLLGQLSAKEYLESLLAKRVSELSADDLRLKRHSDAVFTDNYSRYRKQMAAKKYLNSVLAGKRSPEDALMLSNQSKSTDSSLPQTYQDEVDQLLQQLPL